MSTVYFGDWAQVNAQNELSLWWINESPVLSSECSEGIEKSGMMIWVDNFSIQWDVRLREISKLWYLAVEVVRWGIFYDIKRPLCVPT